MNWGTNNNNGNLLGSTFVHTGGAGLSGSLTFGQTFIYDGVNRLNTITETGNFSRSFAYDPYGNMFVSYASASMPTAGNTPTSYVYNSNNQISSSTYDDAGNQVAVNGNSITYDAENHQTNVVGAGVNETYVYDGDGRHVGKYANTGTPTSVFVYDASGRMAAEYSTYVDSPNCITCYLSADHIGTPRLTTDQSGNVIGRHDYLPFGEEIQANTAGRNAQWGSGNDSINQKFTAKERDSESGLDYFGARYYGSALGRFSSPDPEQASASLFNPQLWNGYSYSINNPLAYKDPDGRNPLLVTAAVGAGVGALVGGGFEFYSQWSQNGYSTDSLNWGKVGTAALGGGVTGGVAGLTLGLGTAAGITLGVGETVAVNAGANIIGGEAQRQANDALGLQAAPSGADEAAAIAIDGITGGVGGLVGGRIADEIYPLPNVKKEIELLKFANRRSTRAAQRLAFDRAVDRQAAQNAATSGVQGGSRTSVGTWWSQLFWNFFSHPQQEPKACVSVSDSASGSHFGGCN